MHFRVVTQPDHKLCVIVAINTNRICIKWHENGLCIKKRVYMTVVLLRAINTRVWCCGDVVIFTVALCVIQVENFNPFLYLILALGWKVFRHIVVVLRCYRSWSICTPVNQRSVMVSVFSQPLLCGGCWNIPFHPSPVIHIRFPYPATITTTVTVIDTECWHRCRMLSSSYAPSSSPVISFSDLVLV